MGKLGWDRMWIWCGWQPGRLIRWDKWEEVLQSQQTGTNSSTQETEITHLHETAGKNVLEEALHEFLGREGALLELPGIGCAVAESDLGGFHAAAVLDADQTAIAESDAKDIGCQITQGSLPIAHGFAVYNPIAAPDFGGDECEEGCLLQQVLKGGTE